MNLLQNRIMHPQLRDEETLVIENAIRLAIDSIVNVLCSINGSRTREYERMLGERDTEIKRLSRREKDFERELQLVRRQGCSCGLYDANEEHCPGFTDTLQAPGCSDPMPGCSDPMPGCSDPRPGCEDAQEDEMAAAAVHGQCEMSFSLGIFDTSPSLASTQSQGFASPPPSIRPAFQQTPGSHPPEAIDALDGRQTLSNGPVIKEEPSDMDPICEGSDLQSRTGMLGHGDMLGDFRGHLYPGPDRPGGAEQHMMSRQRLEPDEAQRLKREAWRAASRRYYARKMARLRAHRAPQGQLHPLGATASVSHCFLPASMTSGNFNRQNININNNNNNMNNNSRKRRKRILELPAETQSSQREAWRAASKRYYARRTTVGGLTDDLDLAHFLQSAQPSGTGEPQS